MFKQWVAATISRMWTTIGVREKAEKAWKHWAVGWIFFLLFSCLIVFWLKHIPTVGKSIGVLAAVAAVMAALMENLKALAKVAWIVLLFGFVWVEMKAIDKDKIETTKALTDSFKSVSDEAQRNLGSILEDEHQHFKSVSDDQRVSFSVMMGKLGNQQRQQNREFSAILDQQQALFQRQQEFSEFLSGKLLPASEDAPSIEVCRPRLPGMPIAFPNKNTVFIFLGTHGNVGYTSEFPKTILSIDGHDVVSVDRTLAGSLVVSIDIRDTAGRIIAKLNKDGFIVSKDYDLYLLRPDKSTLIVDDVYGNQMLKAHFINPTAFSVEGTLQYQGNVFELDKNGMWNSCFGGSRGPVIAVQ
jgi:hypothetical protein